ncbi:MAG: hypothetical protein BRD23_06590 [Halobacteriales archaeon SW_9_67_25]|nr:MAG: hypothetical protein BRD23_06590 [Halobacteriales archaeon SW_9_67_25]
MIPTSDPSRARGVSPVIGVVLMLALTMVLVAAVAPAVFGSLGDVRLTKPDAEVIVHYDEGVPSSQTDSFANTQATLTGDGLVTVRIESVSEPLDADRLYLRVDDTTHPWVHDDTPFDPTDTATVGTDISLWVQQGKTVRLVWNASSGDRGYVLASYSVPEITGEWSSGSDGGGGGVPDPDRDCSWLDGQTPPPGDVEIDGFVLECDLDDYDVHNLDIKGGGAVIGVTEAEGNINYDGGTTYDANATALDGNNIKLKTGSVVNGNVNSSSGADLNGGSQINGNLDAEGSVNIQSNSRVTGDVDTTGTVQINSNSRVDGAITTDGDVDPDSSTIGGKIVAQGTIDTIDDTTVKAGVESTGGNKIGTDSSTVLGDVRTGGVISLDNGTSVDGDVESTGGSGVKILAGSTVTGDVATDGDVKVKDSTVEGDVYASTFDCTNSTINGQDCSSYNEKDYNDY